MSDDLEPAFRYHLLHRYGIVVPDAVGSPHGFPAFCTVIHFAVSEKMNGRYAVIKIFRLHHGAALCHVARQKIKFCPVKHLDPCRFQHFPQTGHPVIAVKGMQLMYAHTVVKGIPFRQREMIACTIEGKSGSDRLRSIFFRFPGGMSAQRRVSVHISKFRHVPDLQFLCRYPVDAV